jgi:hypothetical protein
VVVVAVVDVPVVVSVELVPDDVVSVVVVFVGVEPVSVVAVVSVVLEEEASVVVASDELDDEEASDEVAGVEVVSVAVEEVSETSEVIEVTVSSGLPSAAAPAAITPTMNNNAKPTTTPTPRRLGRLPPDPFSDVPLSTMPLTSPQWLQPIAPHTTPDTATPRAHARCRVKLELPSICRTTLSPYCVPRATAAAPKLIIRPPARLKIDLTD